MFIPRLGHYNSTKTLCLTQNRSGALYFLFCLFVYLVTAFFFYLEVGYNYVAQAVLETMLSLP